ncbi:hypothetical protein O7632_29155 [Solwaraspora sp. WMMD406]|uniref:hypothetical protein n=1 Tax=Solwaraspora sp. WMMD406 TaxID=3016095 RepID=UPI0024165B6D|nr:hypothetical protein [Solwaraspora sp. WMMD406]MDG4768128.1 hypothetical protein [Solwaraspora sp. WMMD406]
MPVSSTPASPTPLIDEAMKKAAVAWVSVDRAPARVMWCVPVDGALHLVTGPGEQPAAGLAPGVPTTVTFRGDHGGQIVTWPATVVQVDPNSPDWEPIATQVAGKRLNATSAAADLVARWATECVLYRLSPAGPPIAAGPDLPDGSLVAPPRPTTAIRPVRRPFRLHRVRRR